MNARELLERLQRREEYLESYTGRVVRVMAFAGALERLAEAGQSKEDAWRKAMQKSVDLLGRGIRELQLVIVAKAAAEEEEDESIERSIARLRAKRAARKAKEGRDG
jgi:hypothetical protein